MLTLWRYLLGSVLSFFQIFLKENLIDIVFLHLICTCKFTQELTILLSWSDLPAKCYSFAVLISSKIFLEFNEPNLIFLGRHLFAWDVFIIWVCKVGTVFPLPPCTLIPLVFFTPHARTHPAASVQPTPTHIMPDKWQTRTAPRRCQC